MSNEEEQARAILPDPEVIQSRWIEIGLPSGKWFHFERRRNRYGSWRWVLTEKKK